MLRPAPHIRYHIAAILAAHWIQFVAQYKRWIRPVVFENVRKVLACRTPVLGCHIHQCKGSRFLMHHGGLKKRWKYQVSTRMKKAHREGQWHFPKSKDFLKEYPCFASMLNKLWHLTCYAYIGASLLDPRFSIKFLGRYTKRAVMAEYRIAYYEGKIVRFSYRDYAEGGKSYFMTLKVHTFMSIQVSIP